MQKKITVSEQVRLVIGNKMHYYFCKSFQCMCASIYRSITKCRQQINVAFVCQYNTSNNPSNLFKQLFH